jgi:hypothetical protein
MRFLSLLLLLLAASSARADEWKLNTYTLSLPSKTCGTQIQSWAWTIAAQRPTVAITHDVMTLELGKTKTVSDRAIIGPDAAWGFWDAPPWSDQGVTLMVRVYPKPGPTAKIDLILIQRHSMSDRGDACHVVIIGDAQRR